MLCDVLTGCQTLDQAAVEFSPGGIVDIPDVCIWLVESGITDPDYEADAKLMATRKNMTLVFLWNRYSKKCAEEGKRFYQYRQYCELYNKWCEENYETSHFNAVIAQKMEVDFAGQTPCKNKCRFRWDRKNSDGRCEKSTFMS